jgi:hypothetical protein
MEGPVFNGGCAKYRRGFKGTEGETNGLSERLGGKKEREGGR